MRGNAVIGVALSIALPACSTHYQPMPGPRISTVVQGGGPVYVRDGREFPHGFVGGGLVDAVEGDPQATEAAETYRDRNVAGLIVSGIGTLCLIGGIVGLATTRDSTGSYGSSNQSADYIAGGAILCGLAGLIAGPIVVASGQTYQFDAVNIYNDHVEQRMRMPYYPPPGAYPVPPTATAPGPPRLPPPASAPPAPAPPALPPAPPEPGGE